MSSDDAGAFVRKALQLAHQAADGAIEVSRTAEQHLERVRVVPDGAVQAAAPAALKSARHAGRIAYDAVAVADRAYQSVAEGSPSALEAAQEAVKLAMYACRLVRHVGEENEAVQEKLEEWEADEE